jgi:hypothetical protein
MSSLHQAGAREPGNDRFMNQETNGSLPTIPERLSRPAAIARIRATLAALADDENCACAVAARYGVLCGGFTKLPDKEFKSRFAWIAGKRPDATREELEKCVSAYHLGRQETRGAAICCDVETREHHVCDGWNQFDNGDIRRFCLEITGSRISIG